MVRSQTTTTRSRRPNSTCDQVRSCGDVIGINVVQISGSIILCGSSIVSSALWCEGMVAPSQPSSRDEIEEVCQKQKEDHGTTIIVIALIIDAISIVGTIPLPSALPLHCQLPIHWITWLRWLINPYSYQTMVNSSSPTRTSSLKISCNRWLHYRISIFSWMAPRNSLYQSIFIVVDGGVVGVNVFAFKDLFVLL